ncbi:hypothetical protein TUM17567_34460 [Citrobacter amalonaticus]|nr:hypothetical protein TUM17567_34460 [Citrobacter amalonaticus]
MAIRVVALLTFTDATGGQSSRETVANHTPRTGTFSFCVLYGDVGVDFGGVTSETGGFDEQLARKIVATTNVLIFLTRDREQTAREQISI